MFFVQAKMATVVAKTSETAMMAFFDITDDVNKSLATAKRHHGDKGKMDTPLIDNCMTNMDKLVAMGKMWSFLYENEVAQMNMLVDSDDETASSSSAAAKKTKAVAKKPAAAAAKKKPAAAAAKKSAMKRGQRA